MKEQIAALSVEKVQTFLTEVIRSHVQEKQTEDATLKGIVNSSNQISKDFFESIEKQFSGVEKKVLLKCSGVYIFKCYLPGNELEDRLNELFREYYIASQGQKLLRWYCFPSEEMDDLSAVKKAKEALKQAKNWGYIIEKNQDLLFKCNQIQEQEEKTYEKQLSDEFSEDINALRPEKNAERKRFRIAVIKADLDGMGAMFQGISEYEKYQAVSKILYEQVSLDGLYKAAHKCKQKRKTGWLFPFYIAGDDIFFAVAVEDLILGIDVCSNLLYMINQKLQENNILIKLSLSIGVAITFNKEPIRYYMQMVEEQLKIAKSKKLSTQCENPAIMKICIGNLVFISGAEQNREFTQKQALPEWKEFLEDLQLLNEIRSDKGKCSELLGKTNYFYTLLEDISNEKVRENDIAYINHVLYHLLPDYFESSDKHLKEMETCLNYNLIKQLYQENELRIDKRKKQDFEKYLQLMILFSDVRFRIFKRNKQREWSQNKDNLYKYLFKQPRTYLYQKCLQEKEAELTEIFVRDASAETKPKYSCLILETTMFYRLREVESIPIEKAANMIELRNSFKENENQRADEKEKGDKKSSKRLYFEKEKFKDIANKDNWTPEFVDSLMLFYRYNELSRKTEKQNKHKGECQNEKCNKNKGKSTGKSVYRRQSKTV
ncbi:Cas10/Cmr2 second palm domain-containing protein [Parablautia sp. Marseille-Q6255]|uniref:Cas10/Cmr2 second palm domain-containing protein n=1 Tax=Parablautia sp. Marseille-Q6255 TaxID=3039593 RepID=UPI0024BD19C0|nr:hypothetical protein [Parablautia sp. Marseille-Q6255]